MAFALVCGMPIRAKKNTGRSETSASENSTPQNSNVNPLLAGEQLCSKLLKAALPEWLEHHERRGTPLPEAFKEKLLEISPAQIDRLLRPARLQHPKKGLSTTRPGTLLRHAVPTRSGPPDTSRISSIE